MGVPEIVIVGGGISGVCLAWELARRGHRDVLLLERDHLAAGPTSRSGAVIRCHYSTPELVKLALEGRAFFAKATELVGDDCGFREVGFLALVGHAEVAALQTKLAMQREAGLDVDLLRGAEILERMPGLELSTIGAAAWEGASGHADPVRATWAIGRRAAQLGVEVRVGATVREVRVAGGRVQGVVTDDGFIAAGQVVCAAGPWTRRLMAGAGAEIPTTILRNAMAMFLRPPELEKPHPVLIDMERRFYARPDGRLSLTGSVDEAENQLVADPDDFDAGVDRSEIELFGRRLGAAVPALRRAPERGGWVGLYDVSPDWLHLIDEVPSAAGLWVLCGTSGHGFKLAPAIARVAADLVTRPRAEVPEGEMFRLDRLANAPPSFGVLA